MMAKGGGLSQNEIDTNFAQLDEAELQKCQAGADRMKSMLVNIDDLIGKALQQTNDTVCLCNNNSNTCDEHSWSKIHINQIATDDEQSKQKGTLLLFDLLPFVLRRCQTLLA
jgi:hypothetical protein